MDQIQMARSWTGLADRSDWPEGVVDDHEPDRAQWVDQDTGLDMMIIRHLSGGHWCGYVGVPSGHPAHGVEYRSGLLNEIEVHGGLTFSEACHPNEEGADPPVGVCHIPGPGRPDPVWWLGFDCAHCNDLSPGFHAKMKLMGFLGEGDTYRDLAYVVVECQHLARQLDAMGKG